MRSTIHKQFCFRIGIARKLETIAYDAGLKEIDILTELIMNYEMYKNAHDRLINGGVKGRPFGSFKVSPSTNESGDNDNDNDNESNESEEDTDQSPEQLEKSIRRQEREERRKARQERFKEKEVQRLKREGKWVPPFEERYGVEWRVKNGNANIKCSGQIISFPTLEIRDHWIKTFTLGMRYEVITSREQYDSVLKEIARLKELNIDPDPEGTKRTKEAEKKVSSEEEFEKWCKVRDKENARIMADRKKKGIKGNPRLAKLTPAEIREYDAQERKYLKKLKEEKELAK